MAPALLKRFCLNVTFVLLGLATTVGLVHALIPRTRDDASAHEQRTLAARKDCQILFLGPSYVDTQIWPEVFNDEARRLGFPAHACKFGRAGLRGYEMRNQFQKLMKYTWPKLELVVFDITINQRIGFESQNWFKARMLEWHTFDSIPWLAEYYRRDPRPWFAKLPEAWSHLEHVGAHYLLLGRGTELVFAPPSDDDDDDDNDPADAKNDEAGEDSEPAPPAAAEPEPPTRKRSKHELATEERRKRYEERMLLRAPRYRHKLRHLVRNRQTLNDHPQYDADSWPLELRELARGYGLEAYFLYSAAWHVKHAPEATVKGNDRLVLLDFIDPLRFPELYRPEARAHADHIAPVACPIYSRLLARELAQRWRPKR